LRLHTFAEFGAAVAIVFAIQAYAWSAQPRITVNDGKGYDGQVYYQTAARLLVGERPEGEVRFIRRIGTSLLAGWIDSDDLINGFQVANAAAAMLSSVLLLSWFRRFIETPWIRLGLIVVYATHWLQLVRFTFFYPVSVDAWTQVACFAGLNGIAWYEARPGLLRATAVAAVSAAGVVFREAAILVPVAFLFARGPRIEHLPGFPYVRIRGFPRVEQWIPLALAAASLLWIESFIVPTDPTFSSPEFLESRAYDRNPVEYSLGWMIAYGVLPFVMLADWRTTVEFFRRHHVFLAYTGALAGLAWMGSIVSERHSLYWGAPIVYMLFGRTIERHREWFRSRSLVAFLIAAQAIVHRVFWNTPQPQEHYRDYVPHTILTPVGNDVSYLHLFSGYLQDRMVLQQFTQFLLVGFIVWIWIRRRAQLELESRAKMPPMARL
jgi:hypothetical protein